MEMKYGSVCSVLFGAYLCVPVFAQGNSSDDVLVKKFYPQELEATAESDMRLYAFAEADFEGSGKASYLMAAYSNGDVGAIRVLKKKGNSAVIVASPSFPYMGGIYPNVEMLDVDMDGRQEAIVSFSTGTGWGAVNWVMKWNGQTLQSIGPVVTHGDGQVDTELNGGLFLDFSGDAKLEIIAPDHDAPLGEFNIPLWLAVFSLSNGRYEKSGTLDFLDTFARESGAPVEKRRDFTVANVNKNYVLTIMNGSGTEKRVSSAQITLNGTVVAGQEQFKKNAGTIKIPVTVAGENTLGVKLFGEPGSILSVGIGPK